MNIYRGLRDAVTQVWLHNGGHWFFGTHLIAPVPQDAAAKRKRVQKFFPAEIIHPNDLTGEIVRILAKHDDNTCSLLFERDERDNQWTIYITE